MFAVEIEKNEHAVVVAASQVLFQNSVPRGTSRCYSQLQYFNDSLWKATSPVAS